METQRKQNFVEYIINQKSHEVAVLKDIKLLAFIPFLIPEYKEKLHD